VGASYCLRQHFHEIIGSDGYDGCEVLFPVSDLDGMGFVFVARVLVFFRRRSKDPRKKSGQRVVISSKRVNNSLPLHFQYLDSKVVLLALSGPRSLRRKKAKNKKSCVGVVLAALQRKKKPAKTQRKKPSRGSPSFTLAAARQRRRRQGGGATTTAWPWKHRFLLPHCGQTRKYSTFHSLIASILDLLLSVRICDRGLFNNQ
jgi:hypothetical protein